MPQFLARLWSPFRKDRSASQGSRPSSAERVRGDDLLGFAERGQLLHTAGGSLLVWDQERDVVAIYDPADGQVNLPRRCLVEILEALALSEEESGEESGR